MSEEEKNFNNDILFQIDMELYDEFNDKFCEMNDHLGDFYCYKDIDDLEKIKKDTEIDLLRKAIAKLQKQIEELKKYETYYKEQNEVNKKFISKQKIKQKIKEMKEANYYLYRMGINRTTEEDFALKSIIETLEELLEEED